MLLTWPSGIGLAGQGPSFVLGLDDLGAGIVDTSTQGVAVTPTFTRATSSWTNLSNGNIGLVASGSPRSFYSPAGVYLGYLAEGARTNLVQRGEDFSTVWSAVGTPTLSAGTTTIGALSLSTVGDDSAAALEGYTQSITFTGDAVKAVAIYVKQGTSTSSVVRIRDTTGAADRLLAAITWSGSAPVVTMTTGTDLTGTPAQQGTSGVYRLSFATTAVTAASANQIELYPATDAALSVGNTGTIEWGGVQAEDATFASSLIRTPASATVTRNADVLTYPFVAAAPGTLFAQWQQFSVETSAAKWAVAADDGTANEMVLLGMASGATAMQGNVTDGGVGQASVNVGTIAANTSIKGAIAYATNSVNVAKDGTLGTEDTSATMPTVTTLNVGLRAAASSSLFGPIRRIAYWATRLSNSQLQQITS